MSSAPAHIIIFPGYVPTHLWSSGVQGDAYFTSLNTARMLLLECMDSFILLPVGHKGLVSPRRVEFTFLICATQSGVQTGTVV